MLVLQQIYDAVDHIGRFKGDFETLKNLHPYAERIIQRALMREREFITSEDIYLLSYEINELSNEVLKFLTDYHNYGMIFLSADPANPAFKAWWDYLIEKNVCNSFIFCLDEIRLDEIR